MIAIWVAIVQYAIGFALIRRSVGHRSPPVQAALAVLIGMPASSLIVLAIDVSPLPLTPPIVIGLLTAIALIANRHLRPTRPEWRPRVSLGEITFLVPVASLVLLSLLQRARMPILARDMVVGPDLVAKFAVLEGTINSSVFSSPLLTGFLSNQPFYAPFVMLMQTLYRLAGSPVGTLWLSVLVVAFLAAMYGWLRARLGGVLAGLLLALFAHDPLMFTYTSVVLTDYANAVFLGLAAACSFDFIQSRRRGDLYLAAAFAAAACWTRSETVLFLPGGALIVWVGSAGSMRDRVRDALVFAVPGVLAIALWHLVYVGLVLDAAPATILAPHLSGFRDIGTVAREIATLAIDTKRYGYAPVAFAIALVLSVAVFRDKRGWPFAAWMATIFLGFIAMVVLFPAASVSYTVKRGMFKLMPVAIFYLAESPLMQWGNERLATLTGMRSGTSTETE